MEVLDAGHKYSLQNYDSGKSQVLTFLKRSDPPERYPGNISSYPGTNCQEVLRALIDRVRYLNAQFPCPETETVENLLQASLYLFEARASRIHNSYLQVANLKGVEVANVCKVCGHIQCHCPEE